MGKRILITSTDLMMIQFLVPHVQNLAEHGYEVEIACSEVGRRMNEVREKLKDYTKAIHTVRLVRSPASLTNLKGYQDMNCWLPAPGRKDPIELYSSLVLGSGIACTG